MARLPVSGGSVGSPFRSEGELEDVLRQLGVDASLGSNAVRGSYARLAKIIGKWLAEQHRLEVSPVAKALLSMGQNLTEIARTLDALNTGFRAHFEVEVAHLLAQYVAHDPTVGSVDAAKDLLVSLQTHATQVGHSSLVAHADLTTQSGEPGRPRMDWYDDFTALLLDLAAAGQVKPQLQKNRITGIRSGWFLDATQWKAFSTLP